MMKKLINLLVLMNFLLGVHTLYAQRASLNPTYVPNQVIILFNPNLKPADIAAVKKDIEVKFRESITSIKTIFSSDDRCGIPNLFVWEIDGVNVNIINIVNDAIGRAGVSSCDPNYTTDPIPQDILLPTNSNFELLRTDCRVSTTDKKVKIGFADTGLDGFEEERFTPRHTLFQAFGNNITGLNMIKTSSNAQDDHRPGHGTHVTGIFAQICSLYNVQNKIDLYIYKTQENDGSGSLLNLIKAFDNALCQRVNIMNLSLSWKEYPFDSEIWENRENRLNAGSVMERLFDYMAEKGMLIVGAAGNDYTDVDAPTTTVRICPAVYKSKSLIIVNATDGNNGLAPFSNKGKNSVNISALGTKIYSTIAVSTPVGSAPVGFGNWGTLDGTSMATPQVTAEAAILALTQTSNTFDYKAIRDAILNNTTPKGYLTVTGGMANICDAVNNQCLVAPIAGVSVQPTCTTLTGKITVYSTASNIAYDFGDGMGYQTTPSKVLPVGTYQIRVRNTMGCVSNPTSVTIVPPSPPVITSLFNTTICAGTSATLTANGGGTYSWNTNANTAAITISPSVTTTYTVTVTGTNGCNTSKSATVTVNALPNVTSLNNVTVCAGTSTTLTANGGGTYSWNTNANTSEITISPSVTTTYTVTVTGTNGCNTSKSATVTVNALPNVTVLNNVTVCAGASTTLTANGGGTYSWNTNANTAAITISPSLTTTYTVTVTGTNSCKTSKSATVTVNPLPNITTLNNVTVCAGASTTLTANGGGTYSWNTNANTAAITISPSLTTTYTVTVTGTNGCQTSKSATVTVNPLPNITTLNNVTVCAGTSTTLTANGGGTYSWNTNASTPAITISPSVTTTYTVTVTGTNGCKTSKSATVTVNNLPNVTTLNNATVCAGTSTTLTANGGGTYSWNTNASTPTITISPSVTTTYTVTVAGTNGCKTSKSATVTVNPLPNITTLNNVTVCAGTSTTLTANGGGTYSWNTNANTAAITISPSVTTTYTVTVTGTNSCKTNKSATVTVNVLPNKPTVTVTSALVRGTCTGTITVTAPTTGVSYIFDNMSQSLPVKSGVPSGLHTVKVKSTTTTCESASINVGVMCDISPIGRLANSNQTQSTSATPSLNTLDKQDMAEDWVLNTKQGPQTGLMLFPNPAINEISIDLSLYEGLPVNIQFYNSIGSLVLNEQIQEANATTHKFDINALPIGSYLIRVQAKDRPLEVKRFIIVR